MKTREFIKKVEEMGFSTKKHEKYGCKSIYIFKDESMMKMVAEISEEYPLIFDNVYSAFEALDYPTKLALYNLIKEYAETPLREREEEKRYHLKFPSGFNDRYGEYSYLNQLRGNPDAFFVAGKTDTDRYKAIFTDSDIAELPEKYKAGVGCEFIEKVEVVE